MFESGSGGGGGWGVVRQKMDEPRGRFYNVHYTSPMRGKDGRRAAC